MEIQDIRTAVQRGDDHIASTNTQKKKHSYVNYYVELALETNEMIAVWPKCFEKLENYRRVFESPCFKDGRILEHVPVHLRDFRLCFCAVTASPDALQWLPPALRDDPILNQQAWLIDPVAAKVHMTPNALRSVHDNLFSFGITRAYRDNIQTDRLNMSIQERDVFDIESFWLINGYFEDGVGSEDEERVYEKIRLVARRFMVHAYDSRTERDTPLDRCEEQYIGKLY